MTAVARVRPRLAGAVLPAAALVLVVVVLVVQLVAGGGRYTPTPLADPCTARGAARMPTTLDALGQALVLQGLDGAACRLGTSREALTLQLAQDHTNPSPAQVAALRAGLLQAVGEMKSDGTLPPASDLVGAALDATDVNPVVKLAIRALPGGVIDRALPTDEVLRQAVENLDVRSLLVDIGNPNQLDDLVTQAVVTAVEQTLGARLRGLL